MTQPTWKDDLLSLHQQRKNLLRNLRFLYEQSSKVSRVSVTTHNEIEEIKIRLQEVEKQILNLQDDLGTEVENIGIRKIEGFSPYLSGGQDDEIDNALAYQDLPSPHALEHKYGKRQQSSKIFLIIAAVVVLAIILLVIARPYLDKYLSSSSQTSGEILIYSGYYHIGDVYMQQFHSPNPQPNPFISNFQITTMGADPHLVLIASHVDPNVAQSPVSIFVNANWVGYLNDYFTQETLEPKQVSIPVNLSYLEIGNNRIQILSEVTTVEYQTPNLDDFEFWELKLEFSEGK